MDNTYLEVEPSYKVLSTNSNLKLSDDVCRLIYGLEVYHDNIKYHPNSEIKAQINSNIRGLNIYIIATASKTQDRSINDHLMEALCLANACKLSSAKSICLILPCFPYARSDKKDDGRCAIGAALVCGMIKESGVTRIVSVDLHSGQIQGFTNIPFDNLYAINIFCDYIGRLIKQNPNSDYILVSPDNGGAKRVVSYAKKLNMPHAIMNKQRNYGEEGGIETSTLLSASDVTGATAIVIDDMIDTCGTMVSACKILKEKGMKNAIVIATHGVLSGLAIERINSCDFISNVVVTDSIPQTENIKRCPKISVETISILISNVIQCLETGASISDLFK